MSSKLLAIGSVAAAIYGVGVGLQAHVKQPSSQAEANQTGSLGSLGMNALRDTAIAFADDALILPAIWGLKKMPSMKSYRGMLGMAQSAVMVGGASIAGAIGGHDFQNFVAARAYSSTHNDDLSLSQALIPDPRLNSIEGFRNKGMTGLQRRDMTGIGSPAAGGIFYRMKKLDQVFRNRILYRYEDDAAQVSRRGGKYFTAGSPNQEYNGTGNPLEGGSLLTRRILRSKNPYVTDKWTDAGHAFLADHGRARNLTHYLANLDSGKVAQRYLRGVGLSKDQAFEFAADVGSKAEQSRSFRGPLYDRLGAELAKKQGFDAIIGTRGDEVFVLDPSALGQGTLANHKYLSLSKAMIPDRRINGIEGFQSGGMGAAQRTRMTGIASPAAGGIFYRMKKLDSIFNKRMLYRYEDSAQSVRGGKYFSIGRSDPQYNMADASNAAVASAMGGTSFGGSKLTRGVFNRSDRPWVADFAHFDLPAAESEQLKMMGINKRDIWDASSRNVSQLYNLSRNFAGANAVQTDLAMAIQSGGDVSAVAAKHLRSAGMADHEITRLNDWVGSTGGWGRGSHFRFTLADAMASAHARKSGYTSLHGPGAGVAEAFVVDPSVVSTARLANARLRASQAMIPDRRINKIDGFKSGGPGSAQRTRMTGIASPAAGGIFYRMWHNPFADTLNNAVANPGNAPAQDPRSKALGFSVFGSILGGALGAPKGLARATMLGIAGGTLGGLYGIQSAHNPDAGLNARALGDVALGAAPTMGMAGILYGLSSARAGRFGGVAARALERASQGMNWAGGQLGRLDAANRALQPKVVNAVRRGRDWARDGLMSSGAMAQVQSRVVGLAAKHGRSVPQLDDLVLNKIIPGAAKIAAYTAVAPLRVAHSLTSQGLTPLLSHQASNRWEQSLGIGHLITIVPHQIAVGAAAAGIVQSRRGKNSTNTMPSNSAR